jgi:hypothetical protein
LRLSPRWKVRDIEPHLENVGNWKTVSLYCRSEKRCVVLGNAKVNIRTALRVLKRQPELSKDLIVHPFHKKVRRDTVNKTHSEYIGCRKQS